MINYAHSKTLILLCRNNHSLSIDATIMVSRNCPITKVFHKLCLRKFSNDWSELGPSYMACLKQGIDRSDIGHRSYNLVRSQIENGKSQILVVNRVRVF